LSHGAGNSRDSQLTSRRLIIRQSVAALYMRSHRHGVHCLPGCRILGNVRAPVFAIVDSLRGPFGVATQRLDTIHRTRNTRKVDKSNALVGQDLDVLNCPKGAQSLAKILHRVLLNVQSSQVNVPGGVEPSNSHLDGRRHIRWLAPSNFDGRAIQVHLRCRRLGVEMSRCVGVDKSDKGAALLL
jgi:hypothetical protein